MYYRYSMFAAKQRSNSKGAHCSPTGEYRAVGFGPLVNVSSVLSVHGIFNLINFVRRKMTKIRFHKESQTFFSN